MKSLISSIVTFAALGLLGVACNPGVEPAPAATERTACREATPHGVVQMIGEALSEVMLTADQEAAVEVLGARVEPLQAEVDRAESELLARLADMAESEHVDRAAMASLINAYVEARVRLAPALRAALEELHGLLDADQRADFADALESAVHQAVRGTALDERVAAFSAELGLDGQKTQELRDRLEQIRPILKAERHDIHEAVEAFRGASFSIEPYLPLADVAPRAQRRAEQIVELTEAILAMLDAEQRAKLAERIRLAAEARGEAAEGPGLQSQAAERLGAAADHIWAGAVRGPRGGRAVVVGRAGGFYGWRARAYPVAVGWGVGW